MLNTHAHHYKNYLSFFEVTAIKANTRLWP